MRQRPYILSAACYPSQHERCHTLDFALPSMNNSMFHSRKNRTKPKINLLPLLTCISARIPFTRLSISGWNVEMHKTIVTIVTSYRCCCCRIYISIVAVANAPKTCMKNEYTSFDLFVSALGSAETALSRLRWCVSEWMSQNVSAEFLLRVRRFDRFEILVQWEFHRRKTFRLWDSVNEWISISRRPSINR